MGHRQGARRHDQAVLGALRETYNRDSKSPALRMLSAVTSTFKYGEAA